MSITEKHRTNLAAYNNSWYDPGAGTIKRTVWYMVNAAFISSWMPFGSVRRSLLKMFGARIGRGVVIKPRVNIKSPWLLEIGDHCWIGEGVWIDNLVKVTLGNNVCLSQDAMLLTGNHNYKSPTFDLITGEISISNGSWIGAKAVVSPGVSCGEHSVLTVSSVATSDLEPYSIYQGNPAVKVRERIIAPK